MEMNLAGTKTEKNLMEIYGNIWNRTAGTREMCIAGESRTSLRYENKTEKTRAFL